VRQLSNGIWRKWQDDRTLIPLGWVTIEKDWFLSSSEYTNPSVYTELPDVDTGEPDPAPPERDHPNTEPANPYNSVKTPKGPFRWWQRADNDQIETVLPNVESIEWNRSVESQAAECTLVLGNQNLMANGEVSGRPSNDLGRPGYMTPNRGGDKYVVLKPDGVFDPRRTGGASLIATSLWEHDNNEWYNEIVPNALFRTYEGYAETSDPEKTFEQAKADGDVVLTGVWLANSPTFDSRSRKITIPCQDMTKLLLQTQMYPPFMPADSYPLRLSKYRDETIITPVVESILIDPGSISVPTGEIATNQIRRPATYSSSSSDVHYGGSNHGVYGWYPANAIDENERTFWLSEGYQGATQPYGTVWWEADLNGQSMDSVELTTWGSGFVAYVSLRIDGKWIGSKKIPYSLAVLGNTNAGIKYIAAKKLGRRTENFNAKAKTMFDLGRTYDGVEKVRISFRHLQNSKLGDFPYRAGIREVKFYDTTPLEGGGGGSGYVPPTYENRTTYTTTSNRYPGNYCVDDQTEILTKRGWLHWDEVKIGDESLSINPLTGTSEWSMITEMFVKDYTDLEMVRMEGRRHSSLTTPNHKWLLKSKEGEFSWGTTETLDYKSRIPTSVDRSDTPLVSKYSDEFVELIAWFWTEGSLSDRACIAQSKEVNLPYALRIEKCLYNLYGPPGSMSYGHGKKPCKWRETINNSGVSVYRLCNEVRREFELVAPDRVPTVDFLCSLTKKQLSIFIETSVDADGHRRKDNGVVILTQKDERRIRMFEMACVLAGLTPNTTKMFSKWSTTVRSGDVVCPVLSSQKKVKNPLKVTNELYSGIIWCPTLKHHNWLARRRGTVYFTGNSDYSDIIKQILLWAGWYLLPLRDGSYHRLPSVEQPRPQTTYTTTSPSQTINMSNPVFVNSMPVVTMQATGILKVTNASSAGTPIVQSTVPLPAGTVVNFALETAIGPGGVDYSSSLDPANDWWFMEPGDNTIVFDGTANVMFSFLLVGWKPLQLQYPDVYGNIESTGAYAEAPLPADMFDKRPPIDVINQIRQIVGYFFWIGEEGECHFESPNFYQPGNFDEYGTRTIFIPELNEDTNLFDLSKQLNVDNVRSEIIVSTEEPTENLEATKTTRFKNPVGKDLLRGMVNPVMWINNTFMSLEEQRRMAELISMHIFMSLRQTNATIKANPLLSCNDQVRIIERVTAESSIHYVRSIRSSHNFTTGKYTMTLETNWLGDRENWALRKSGTNQELPKPYRRYVIPDDYETWDRIRVRLNGRYFPERFNINRLKKLNRGQLLESDGYLLKGMELVVG